MHSGMTILLEWVFNLDDLNKTFLQIATANICKVKAQIMRETAKQMRIIIKNVSCSKKITWSEGKTM